MNAAAEVLAAAERRAAALVAVDTAALTALHHPELRWTTYRGVLLDRSAYVAGNTDGSLRWLGQRLAEPSVVVGTPPCCPPSRSTRCPAPAGPRPAGCG